MVLIHLLWNIYFQFYSISFHSISIDSIWLNFYQGENVLSNKLYSAMKVHSSMFNENTVCSSNRLKFSEVLFVEFNNLILKQNWFCAWKFFDIKRYKWLKLMQPFYGAKFRNHFLLTIYPRQYRWTWRVVQRIYYYECNEGFEYAAENKIYWKFGYAAHFANFEQFSN